MDWRTAAELAQWWGRFMGKRAADFNWRRVKVVLESAQARWVKVPTRSRDGC